MNEHEKKLSDYIDRLNEEKSPDDTTDSEELGELYQTVKKVRSLKEPTMPEAGFEKKLIRSVTQQTAPKPSRPKRNWLRFTTIASIAAIILFSIIINLPLGNSNIVAAMEKAFQEVAAYHGVLEVTETNANGESTIQSKIEVWADKDGNYYLKELEGANKGVITVNNGEVKWQIHPETKTVHLLPAFPDNYRFLFELGKEIKQVKNAKTEIIGEESIAGKETTVVQVTPDGGNPYKIWVDNETNLPLQKQSTMYNALSYTITYTAIDFAKTIPAELLAYDVPKGFTENTDHAGQVVTNVSEAQELVGFEIKLPEETPENFVLDEITVSPDNSQVNVYYQSPNRQEQIVIMEKKATTGLTPHLDAVLGKINDTDAEIQAPILEDAGLLGVVDLANNGEINSIRWHENGLEISVLGNVTLEKLAMVTNSISKGELELSEQHTEIKPDVEVPYDLTVEENEQKSVDAGNSPWRLDPAYVAQVFVSLMISPEGIQGEYPIDYNDLQIVEKTEQLTIIDVNSEESPVKRVYLERLIRQDATGIWTVIGYDE